MNTYANVKAALERLCKEHEQRFASDYPLFTAKQVAEVAHVSESTARKYLNYLTACRGFERHKGRARISYGYRVSPY